MEWALADMRSRALADIIIIDLARGRSPLAMCSESITYIDDVNHVMTLIYISTVKYTGHKFKHIVRYNI